MFVRATRSVVLRRCWQAFPTRTTIPLRALHYTSTSFAAEQLQEPETPASAIAFAEAGVSAPRVSILNNMGIVNMFPIQEKTYSIIREGKDVIGRAKTGSGKTLAFAIPLIERYEGVIPEPGTPTIVILAPTRELAIQVHSEIQKIAPRLQTACIYGGQSINIQAKALSKPVDIVVGTPGRTIHFIEEGQLRLHKVKAFVLDEADQMLDIGFKDDIERVMEAMPDTKQTLLFSATVPQWVQGISSKYMNKPAFIDMLGKEVTPEELTHAFIRIPVASQRIVALAQLIAKHRDGKMLIFVDTKLECAQLSSHPLIAIRSIRSLHGDINQQDRASTLDAFRSGNIKILIATDVAARGLDIPGVDVVIHYRPPQKIEGYIHRAGRCGRAGKIGTSITLITPEDASAVAQIEKQIKKKLVAFPVPSQSEIDAINQASIAEMLSKVPRQTSEIYMDTAKNWLASENGLQYFASALALLSGKTSRHNFSMLTGQEGYCTIELSSTKQLSKFSAISYLRLIDENFSVGQSFLTKSGTVVVDVESAKVDTFLNYVPETKDAPTINIVNDFPEISNSPTGVFREGHTSRFESGRGSRDSRSSDRHSSGGRSSYRGRDGFGGEDRDSRRGSSSHSNDAHRSRGSHSHSSFGRNEGRDSYSRESQKRSSSDGYARMDNIFRH